MEDLSEIDLGAPTAKFKWSKHKNTDIEVLKAAITSNQRASSKHLSGVWIFAYLDLKNLPPLKRNMRADRSWLYDVHDVMDKGCGRDFCKRESSFADENRIKANLLKRRRRSDKLEAGDEQAQTHCTPS